MFYAIGDYGALGFDPWSIDESWPNKAQEPPLVDPIGGEWSSAAYWLRDSYIAIGRAMAPIIAAQGTEHIFTCVQEPAEHTTGWAAQGCDVMITYHHREGNGRAFIIQQGPLDSCSLASD